MMAAYVTAAVFRACSRCGHLVTASAAANAKHVSRKVQTCLLSTSQNPLLRPDPAGEATVDSQAEYPADYEVSYSEFKFVEDVLPKPTVPDVPQHESYPTPSGWFPPNDEIRSQKRFLVRRTKNHMLPVYPNLQRFWYGMNHKVTIRQIEGDIWALESELRDFLQKKTGFKKITTQVHEVSRQIHIRGLHAPLVAEFLLGCGM